VRRWRSEAAGQPTEGTTTVKAPHESTSPTGAGGRTDSLGRFHAHGLISYWVVGAYLVLLGLILLVIRDPSGYVWVTPLLVTVVVLLLVRYLSTTYRIDDTHLRAWRVLGGRRVELAEIRSIEFASLRDISPVGFFGAWGWRGRMWSPRVGTFDAIYTDTTGLLISEGDVPIFISPVDPDGFAVELSRRVRSYAGSLKVDVGDPAQRVSLPAF
jgi:hypothetical protein